MKSIVAVIGLAIMFAAVPPRSVPMAASAGEVLFTEGQAIAPEPLPPLPQPSPAPAPRPIVIDADGLAESVGRFLSQVTPPKPVDVPKAEEPAPVDPTWLKAVYPVRLVGISRGQRADMGGSAVAVGPAKLHTVSHLTHQLTGYRAEVQIGGEWKPATFAPVAGRDLAVLTLPAGSPELEYAPLRVPEYGERVTVYGLKSKSFSDGLYAGVSDPDGSALVSLSPGATATQQGDSGGGIFGDDGAFLGTLTGFNPLNSRLAKVVPIVGNAPPVSAAPAVKAPPAVQNCPGGVCPAPQFNRDSMFNGTRSPVEQPRFLRRMKH